MACLSFYSPSDLHSEPPDPGSKTNLLTLSSQSVCFCKHVQVHGCVHVSFTLIELMCTHKETGKQKEQKKSCTESEMKADGLAP